MVNMEWTEWIIVAVNIFLVVFVFLQVRQSYQPIISTKIVSREKDVNDHPSVLEYGDLYSIVSNDSTNLASNIRIEYIFYMEDKKLLRTRRNLRYLGVHEAMREPLSIGEILSKHQELFEEHSIGNEAKKMPKETLNLVLEIRVKYRFGMLPYTMHDSYKIEWGSMKNYPDFKDHPILNCWNMRDGHYIYKIG